MKWNRPIRFQGGVRFLELSVGDGVGLLELNVSDGVIAKQTNFSDKEGDHNIAFRLFVYFNKISGQETNHRSRIKLTIWGLKACCRDPGPFPWTSNQRSCDAGRGTSRKKITRSIQMDSRHTHM